MIFLILVCCTKTNLATLLELHGNHLNFIVVVFCDESLDRVEKLPSHVPTFHVRRVFPSLSWSQSYDFWIFFVNDLWIYSYNASVVVD
jgi:hypothetical protein